MLQEIIERQNEIRDGIRKIQGDYRPPRPPTTPTIAQVEVVVLKKGESVTVSHTIRWHDYEDDDDLEVKVAASDRSLVVPEKFTVNYEKHQFRFSYEIQAGDKVGEFTVTLAPAAGKAVTVKVLVK